MSDRVWVSLGAIRLLNYVRLLGKFRLCTVKFNEEEIP
jgi:hypothetical protein